MEEVGASDPVVKEIPVFLSKTLAEKLFIFQYPLRSSRSGFDNLNISKSSIKPGNQEVRLEVSLDTDNVNYDHSKGEQIALNVDGALKHDQEGERAFDSHIMDKTVLHSMRALPDCSNYAVGVFLDGELHLTPLKGVVQMRPQFHYLDKSDKRVKDEAKVAGEEAEDEEESVKQVNVTFARQEPEFLKKMREQSFQHHTKKSLEEQWVHTEYVKPTTGKAELTRMEMISTSNEDSVNTLNLTSEKYLSLLVPPPKEDEIVKAADPNPTMSLKYIRTLPLLDQIRIFVKDAKVMAFSQLRILLSSGHDPATVLKYLQQVAVLVQGNWIVNSELVYPKDTVSAHNGIPSDLMCRARDYVLLAFTESQHIDRKTISSVVKLPSEEVSEIFTNLARHQTKKGWSLILPRNQDFLDRHPEIAQRQEMLWEAKRKHLREAMEPHNQPPQRQRRKSNRESIGSENEERNVGRGRKTLRDSSVSDNDSSAENAKQKKTNRPRKSSETT
ncbi:DNA-directed RNA polymerase III subunit RPC5 [Neodiprion fabricii]|uniref:DNA-directed RNA polymerase III subunit RPC5 n=1 Tax=Neodiprion fabricii TaxID=2872261 RepID=UPI001ED8C183|nr:DNA-directed RNA polymerase III subunit RPC5 [Neodiprion fabricii]